MVLARRIRRSGLGRAGGRVIVVVVGAGAGRREVAGSTGGAGSGRAAAGSCRSVEQPHRAAASATTARIRNAFIARSIPP